MKGKKVILVEKELIVAEDLRLILLKHGLIVQAIATTAREALEHGCQMRPDIVLMDLQLDGGTTGLETAKRIQPYCTDGIILITALPFKKINLPSTLMDVLSKPFVEQDLIGAIQKLILRASACAEAKSGGKSGL